MIEPSSLPYLLKFSSWACSAFLQIWFYCSKKKWTQPKHRSILEGESGYKPVNGVLGECLSLLCLPRDHSEACYPRFLRVMEPSLSTPALIFDAPLTGLSPFSISFFSFLLGSPPPEIFLPPRLFSKAVFEERNSTLVIFSSTWPNPGQEATGEEDLILPHSSRRYSSSRQEKHDRG